MINADTAQKVIQHLGFTSGAAAYLLGEAQANGQHTGFLDAEDISGDSPLAGILVTAHHAGDRTFMIEIH